MATKARQQYFADEVSLSKEKREFSIADEIQQKIDSIEEGAQVNKIETVKVNGTALVPDAYKAVDIDVPEVIDNLYTVDSDNALSAKQGKLLYDYIQNIASRGRFLSNWNSATGLPVTNPTENPYPYKAGDYYSVSNVASGGGTNYRPDGGSYTIGQASTTVETEEVNVSDFYLYDGTNWLLLVNTARQIAVDSSLSTTSTNPVENRVITNALNGKADISDINTKTFPLSGTGSSATVLAEAQAAYDRFKAGKKALVFYDKKTYVVEYESWGMCRLKGIQIIGDSQSSYTYIKNDGLYFSISGTTVSAVYVSTMGNAGGYLKTETNYSTPYTPEYPGSPATKKYVDDNIKTYTAGANVQISNQNVISATDTKYTAGTGISIDANNVISNTQTSAEWGNITGTLSDQTDLQNALNIKGDMKYADYNWVTKTGNSIELSLNSEITPSTDFTVNAPSTIKDGQTYLLRVNSGAIAYTMTLGTNMTNPYSEDLTLSANEVSLFAFTAINGNLELQPRMKETDLSNYYTKTETDTLLGDKQGTLTAGTGISIDANNVISNTQTSAEWGNITGTLSDQTDLQTALDAKQDDMVILKYGISTWSDFITAYNKNAVVYCRASSSSNPASGAQTRLAFMAYVNQETNPTSVEFQYYRSRSDHNTQANQLDQVFVYTLTSANGGTWSVTERNTGAKAVAGTGINLAFGSGNMTISADTTTLATQTDLNSKQDTLVSGTNIKSINNNSLLGSGDLTLNDVKVSSTAPSSPTEGMLWYDTTNDELKVYDGSQWNVTGKEYNAGEGIEIGSVVINGRQGPAPEGFHVPSADEWAGLKDIMDNAGLSSGNNWSINLYMPFSGYRYDDGEIDDQGTEGRYWSSTPFSGGTGLQDEASYYLSIATTGYAKPREFDIRSYGYSIRCFKDTPVEIEDPINPGGDWDLIDNVGAHFYIFHSPSLGVITIMNRNSGREYTTIADKNLGATTVYNDGDTLSEANCGKYYQWGNNYGFSWTGAITTSGTQVDASGYGPGNYYSSDTFITGYPDWSSVRNPNLWGDTTGTITQDNVIKNTGVLSVNGQTGNITIETFRLAPNSPLTPKYRRYGTQAQYDALTQYYTDEPGDTVYFTI